MKNNIFPFLLFVASGFYLSVAFTYDMISRGIPGSGFFPRIIGIALVILTGFDLIKNFKEHHKTGDSLEKKYVKDMLVLIIICVSYVLLFNILGALLSTLLFTIASLSYLNGGKWKQNLLISILVPVIVFVMFEVLLNTGLPGGILENWI